MDDLDDLDEDDRDVDRHEDRDEPRRMSSFVQGLWIVGQSIVAVIFGAGLFVAFDQLWKWNNIIALVLSVLVILGLVVGVRVVRKTEDIGSTLIAVAVGALVTLGPLALLQSG
jgi:F0F1-type ATP synthase assembly protein I